MGVSTNSGGEFSYNLFEDLGTGIHSAGHLESRHNIFQNIGQGIHLDDGASAVITHSTIRDAREAGIRVNDAPLYLAHCVIEDSKRGIDLGPGARGLIDNSRIVGSDEDIRYAHDVMVYVFNSVARHVLNWTSGKGLQQVNASWGARRVLWTTKLSKKAKLMGRVGKWALSLGAGELALTALGLVSHVL
jgi:hypothetical protein